MVDSEGSAGPDARGEPERSVGQPEQFRTPLSRQRIIEAAVALVDEQGLRALTMRRVAHELGVEAMSLYHYINGREDLLEKIVDYVVESVRVPPGSVIGPRDGWQGYLQQIAQKVRGLALQHPGLFPLVATRPPSAPWLRPPLRSLVLVEDFLTAMLQRGVSEEHAVMAYEDFTSFLLGHLLLEVAAEEMPLEPDDEPLREGGTQGGAPDSGIGVADYPTITLLTPRLQNYDPEAGFQKGLEDLLDRLDHDISRALPPAG